MHLDLGQGDTFLVYIVILLILFVSSRKVYAKSIHIIKHVVFIRLTGKVSDMPIRLDDVLKF